MINKNSDFDLYKKDSFSRSLRSLVGFAYGPYPENRLDEILAKKMQESNLLKDRFLLNENDIVLDFGCGMGWTANNLQPEVKEIYGADLNKNFIKHAKSLSKNICFYEMNYSSFDFLSLKNINKIYSLNVFTQFIIYDATIHLKEFFSLLPKGGQIYFNFSHENMIDPFSSAYIRREEIYLESREMATKLMHYYSYELINKLLTQIGFKVIKSGNPDDYFDAWVVAEK